MRCGYEASSSRARREEDPARLPAAKPKRGHGGRMPSASWTGAPYGHRLNRRFAKRRGMACGSGEGRGPQPLRATLQAVDAARLPPRARGAGPAADRRREAERDHDLRPAAARRPLAGRGHGVDLRNIVKPLQAIYRRAKSRGGLPVNPTRDLELPAPRARAGRDRSPRSPRSCSPPCLPGPRVWATALYAGLRYGELRALRWDAVDVAGGTIEVRESWDAEGGTDRSEDETSRRRVPMPSVASGAAARSAAGGAERGRERAGFGRADGGAVPRRDVSTGAPTPPGSTPVGERLRLHQARPHLRLVHDRRRRQRQGAVARSWATRRSRVTFDLYGHLMPGSEREGAALLDAYLDDQSNG